MADRPKTPFDSGRDLVGSLFNMAQTVLGQASHTEQNRDSSQSGWRNEKDANTSSRQHTGEASREEEQHGRSKKEPQESKHADSIPKIMRSLFQMFGPTEGVGFLETPVRTLDDLIVPSSVREQLTYALAGIQQHEILYKEWNIEQIDPHGGCVALNLYGPSGTGKSLCAEALAHALERPLLRVNYAQLESKFIGDTPKNIQAVFRQAQEADAVLFFDEADSVLGRRLSHVMHGADQEVNVSRSVMLQALEHFSGVVLFATNLATHYDSAFQRRMEHIAFPLPDAECRAKLWQYLLIDKVKGKLPLADDIDIDQLVESSKGLSGGDLQQVVLRTARRAVQRPVSQRSVQQNDLLEELLRAYQIKEHIGQDQDL